MGLLRDRSGPHHWENVKNTQYKNNLQKQDQTPKKAYIKHTSIIQYRARNFISYSKKGIVKRAK